MLVKTMNERELEVDAHIAAGRITVYADGQDFLERAIPNE